MPVVANRAFALMRRSYEWALGRDLVQSSPFVGDNLLIGVGTRDPVTFGAPLGVVLAAVVGASAWPAWRTSRIDPLVALRWE